MWLNGDFIPGLSDLSVVETRAIIYDKDTDFGRIEVVNVPLICHRTYCYICCYWLNAEN